MKKILCLVFAAVCAIGLLAGCSSKQAPTDTLTVSVETGDMIQITLDMSQKLTMKLDESKVYFADSIGQEGAYAMFMTAPQIENMNEQFGESMVEKTLGKYTMQVFYAQLDGVPSVAAYMKVGNTGVCFVSAMSEDVLEQLLPYVTVELSA